MKEGATAYYEGGGSMSFRAFQHLSIPEIAGQLLEEWSIDPLWQLGNSTPRIESRVQYGESDYDFFCRLLEEAGIAFALRPLPVRCSY
jgi:type VI secretion system secreted protein VgrG